VNAAGRERLAANLRRLGDYGYPLQLISRARAAELAPDVLIPPEVSEVAWYPSEGYAPPLALLARLWGQAREHGAQLRCRSRPPPCSPRDEAFAAEVLRRLGTLVHGGQYARVQHVALGLRSLPADGHTVAGHDASGHIYILATHSGITLGPLLGRLAAREILHERPAALLSGFRPQRFAAAPSPPPLAPARHAGDQ